MCIGLAHSPLSEVDLLVNVGRYIIIKYYCFLDELAHDLDIVGLYEISLNSMYSQFSITILERRSLTYLAVEQLIR